MAATNVQRIPLGLSLAEIARQGAESVVERLGQSMPCSVVSVSGSIVTVKFEMTAAPLTLPQVTMPVFGPEYIRYPIQKGDKGMAVSADYYLGKMSGLGTGTADLREPPNLSALVFLPIGNKNWSTVDKDAVTLYGPNGVVLRDKDSKVTLTLTPTGVTIDMGGNGNVSIENGDLYVSGAVIAGYGGGDQVNLQTHRHGTGSPATGTVPPTPGT